MEQSANIAYFGYGSLVNLDTLQTPYVSAHPARLRGWKRVWKARPKVKGSFAPIEGLAFLSAERCPDTTIEGMIIVDKRASLPALDKREAMYDRASISHDDIEFVGDNPLPAEHDLFLYVAQPQARDQSARILRSYLDVVLRGFHGHFGEQGIERFISTTANFHWPIHEDRHDPVYPRAISIHDAEVNLFERHIPNRS